jgi:hypothetical protein
MSDDLEQLLDGLADWPPDVQQKVIDAIRAIQAEYIAAIPTLSCKPTVTFAMFRL